MRAGKGAQSATSSAQPALQVLDEWLDPAVELDELAARAARATARHFGKVTNGPTTRAGLVTGGRAARQHGRWTIRLYAPLYLSSYCINHCLYCGFRYPHALERKHLSAGEAIAQAEILGRQGFRHLLLVAGDFPRLTSTEYFAEIVGSLVERGFSVAIEVAAQSAAGYQRLVRAGACGVTIYQETYDPCLYAHYHPRGTKARYEWRLGAPERAAEAGMRRLGLGILLGLADPLADIRGLVAHGRSLERRFPQVRLAFSLPRIHEAPDGFEAPWVVDDETFVRLYCALRLAFPTSDLVLSTRERPALRDRLAGICMTQMSAGSSTVPGGYGRGGADPHDRQQFPIADQRSPAEVAEGLRRLGLDVSWDIV